jgi:hypothetical protein
MALIGTAMVIVLYGVAATQRIGQLPWEIPVVFWLLLVGVNYLVSFLRAPWWVRRRISDARQASARAASVVRRSNEHSS